MIGGVGGFVVWLEEGLDEVSQVGEGFVGDFEV